MKNLKFNTNSWHYRLAHWGNGYVDNNICDYSKQVLMGLLKLFTVMLMIFVITAAASKIIVEMVLGVWFSVLTGTDMFSHTGAVSWLIVFSVLVSGIFMLVCSKLGDILHDRALMRRREIYEHKNDPKPVKKDSFIVAAYKSFKDKYCIQIQFEVENEVENNHAN